jgi:uncharacterized protein
MADATVTRVLAPGVATGEVVVLDEPLSFWGGLDPQTGRVVEARHPQAGETLTGRVIVMSSGRGSSSSSSVLAEAIRLGTAPAAIVLADADVIVALGSIAAAELYGIEVPVVVGGGDGLATGDVVTVHATVDGTVTISKR